MARTAKVKSTVVLRERERENGVISLYLDINRDGNRKMQSLKLYLKKNARKPEDREQNRVNRELAEKIRTKVENEYNHNAFGFVSSAKTNINLWAYFDDYVLKYKKKSVRVVELSISRFKDFIKEQHPTLSTRMKPEQLTKELAKGFAEYLQRISKGEGASTSLRRFKRIITSAYEQNYFIKNPFEGITCKIANDTITKEVLSLDEIKLLAQTPLSNKNVKRAFLFTCYTGVRFVDICKLRYSDVDFSNSTLRFTQSKTEGHSTAAQVTLMLSPTLISLIGEKGKREDVIFDVPSHTACLKLLKGWVARAGIEKHITWHSGRHSAGTNLAANNVDIKTIASILGHSGTKHTDKYLRAVDENKKKALNMLPELDIL